MNAALRSSISVAFLLAFTGTGNAAEPSAFQSQCRQFAQLDEVYFAMERKNANSFWNNPTIRDTYLIALKESAQSAIKAISASQDPEAARAAVLLAGLVRQDTALLQAGYSKGATKYFDGHVILTPLTMAASCDFAPGVSFLLQKDLNPNDGADVGAFNAALVNGNAAIARLLLNAGYRIDANGQRCRSSKFILERNASGTPDDVRGAIESSVCAPATVKNVQYQAYTRQLRDYVSYAGDDRVFNHYLPE